MKKVLALILVLGVTIGSSGCFASFSNGKALNGGYWTTNKTDYIVLNQSGGQIMDVYKLKNAYVESESGSDGVRFADNNGNGVIVQGDTKVIRINNSLDWDKYKEYHIEIDLIPYQEFVKLK